MKLIRRIELTEASSSIEFTSIPQTYTDLKLVLSLRNASATQGQAGQAFELQFNNTTSNRTARFLFGTGSSTGSGTDIYFYSSPSSATANSFGSVDAYIANYAGSAAKSISIDSASESNETTQNMGIHAMLWNSTDAITAIKIVPSYAGSLAQYSSASLYGILNDRSTAPKATGGNITFSDGYTYHTFTSSGTFAPSSTINELQYLVVAGGGGGGFNQGGGGGAGGYRYGTLTNVSTSQTVTVGGGGAAGTSNSVNAPSGSDSVFGSITSAGGGGGASVESGQPGRNGGSGGGGVPAGPGGGSGNVPAVTPSQGNNGWGGNGQFFGPAGGGGGAGAAATSQNGGAGAQWLNGVYYAGGGGGGEAQNLNNNGTGGIGGGGAGGNSGSAQAGTANTGGGGGGGANTSATAEPAGAGGSGIVIVRYRN